MNRAAIVLAAIVTFGLAIANLVLAQNLILPLSIMKQRAGGMPWYVTWGMVWVSVFCCVALGGFLLASVRRK